MEQTQVYSKQFISHLESIWGDGWLSPGGPIDLQVLLEGIDVSEKNILDIGVGAGGPALFLIEEYGAKHVTGIDIEVSVLERAASLSMAKGLVARLTLERVPPGRLTFADSQFDVVFSKDVFVHIADKQSLFSEMYRVLKPGGICVFSDWCCGNEPFSQEMNEFLQNGLGFAMATMDENLTNLASVGFEDIVSLDRNSWFAEYSEAQFQELNETKKPSLIDAVGIEAADRFLYAAKRRAIIARQGHLRPAHFRATKVSK